MALKGSAVIELTNVKTGEKERYVEQNMVTNAISELYKAIGNMKSPAGLTNATDDEYPFRALLGGLVLWDRRISEEASIITKPHGVNMVGCACYNQTNTTTSPCRGSYNATESYFTNSSTEKSMKFVYDFATNQANGTIECLSLTSWLGGWNGFGGDESYVDPCNVSFGSFNYDYFGLLGTNSYCWFAGTSTTINNTLYVDPDEDVFYKINSVSIDAVTIGKYRANLHQRSLFNSMYWRHDLIESIKINLPETLSGANTYIYNYDSVHDVGYIIVSPSAATIAASSSFYVIELDMNTLTATVHTVTNLVGSALTMENQYMVCYGGYIICVPNNSYYVRRISIADSSLTSTDLGLGYYYDYNSNYFRFMFLMGGMLYVRASNGSSNNYRVVMYDPVAAVCRTTGSRGQPTNYRNCRLLIPIKNRPLFYYYPYTTTYGYLIQDFHYLATINNLSRPIEKTSDKTMKITYTIQEV